MTTHPIAGDIVVTSVEIQGESPLNIPVSFRAIGKTLPDVAWDASAKE